MSGPVEYRPPGWSAAGSCTEDEVLAWICGGPYAKVQAVAPADPSSRFEVTDFSRRLADRMVTR